MSSFLPGVPLIESPFFAKEVVSAQFDDATKRIAISLSAKGYAIVDFPEPEIDELAASLIQSMEGRHDLDQWRREGHAVGSSPRLQDAWQESGQVWRIACNRQILALLSSIYGRKAWPFQTLNYPVGPQRKAHSDTVHFHSMPARFMCGVLLALEDIDSENGPVIVYPGSHKWPVYGNEHLAVSSAEPAQRPTLAKYQELAAALIEAHHATPETIQLRKGQALITAANLMYGSEPPADLKRTRWSQCTHYFFEGCAYYTPLKSDPFIASIDFRNLKNIETGQLMKQHYAGKEIPQGYLDVAGGRVPWGVDFAFNAADYLAANKDVKESGTNPYEHYLKYGRREKRKLRP